MICLEVMDMHPVLKVGIGILRLSIYHEFCPLLSLSMVLRGNCELLMLFCAPPKQ